MSIKILVLAVFGLFSVSSAKGSSTQAGGIDCSAWQQNADGLWSGVHPTTVPVAGQPYSLNMTGGCCFGANQSRLLVNGVNVIELVENACSRK